MKLGHWDTKENIFGQYATMCSWDETAVYIYTMAFGLPSSSRVKSWSHDIFANYTLYRTFIPLHFYEYTEDNLPLDIYR